MQGMLRCPARCSSRHHQPRHNALLPPAALPRPPCRAQTRQRRGVTLCRVRGDADDGDDDAGGPAAPLLRAFSAVSPVLDGVAGLLPSSVPRPVAKVLVALFGGAALFALGQYLLNTVLLLLLLLLLPFVAYAVTQTKPAEEEALDEEDDPLATARRIMKKYK